MTVAARRFVGKVAVVTGGSSGIGLAAARRLAGEGAEVILTARGAGRGEEAARSIDPTGERVRFVAGDMADRAAVARVYAAATERFGRVDVVVNAAGSLPLASLARVTDDGWAEALAANLTTAFLSCQVALDHLKAAGGGAIVNVGSVESVAGDRLMGAYAAAKAGVLNLTRTLALEVARDHIRVNVVSPGAVDTPLAGLAAGPPELLAAFEAVIPLGRIAAPAEIAAAIAFLAADEASFVTGANLVVDGGLTAATGHPDLVRLLERGDRM